MSNRHSGAEIDHTAFTRRTALAQLSVFAAAIGSAGIASAQTAPSGHAGHGSDAAAHQPLLDAALACLNTGNVCMEHCIRQLGAGDTSLKECIKTVSVMLPMCETLARLAALDAPRLKEFAKVCADVCDDCEKECRKHAHHAQCKNCGEACEDCSAECRKLLRT